MCLLISFKIPRLQTFIKDAEKFPGVFWRAPSLVNMPPVDKVSLSRCKVSPTPE
jgi:hypothetical protein